MFTLLSIHFFDSPMDELIGKIRDSLVHAKHIYICVTGLHGLFFAQQNTTFKKILNNAAYTVCDGKPIVLYENAIKRVKVQRIYGPDLMMQVCKMAEPIGAPIFLFGTTNETLMKLSAKLKKQFPKIRITGMYAPPFHAISGKERRKIYAQINVSRAQIVFVGLSTPKQEQWMSAARPFLSANVLVGVGAAFDFIAGTKKQAPSWIRAIGLEWLFRLCHEPRRLGKRYAIIIVSLLKLCIHRIKSRLR